MVYLKSFVLYCFLLTRVKIKAEEGDHRVTHRKGNGKKKKTLALEPQKTTRTQAPMFLKIRFAGPL